jgi:hypothetical protein
MTGKHLGKRHLEERERDSTIIFITVLDEYFMVMLGRRIEPTNNHVK